MSKADRIEAFAQELAGKEHLEWADFLAGYIRLFNEQRYYEAHDVLEHLWLQPETPSESPHSDRDLLKGLIQFAGAFVHLQKQFQRPNHPTDGRRLRPAWRLFKLAHKNIQPFRLNYRGFQVQAALQLGEQQSRLLEKNHFSLNPWHPDRAPRLPALLDV